MPKSSVPELPELPELPEQPELQLREPPRLPAVSPARRRWRRVAPTGAIVLAGVMMLPATTATAAPAARDRRVAHTHTHTKHARHAKHGMHSHAAKAAKADFLQLAKVGHYGKVLTDSKHFTLYVLSAERTGKIVCSAACEKIWPPLLVKSSVKRVSMSKGIDGRVGFVKRSATSDQVTYNGYPLYLFVGDTGPRQSKGEGIVHFGGTWGLARASAKKTATTEVLPAKSKAASKSGTTTTSKSGYGY